MALSVKWIIEDGIRKGKAPKAILGILARQLPERNSALKHVRYYANRMVREGEIKQEVAIKKYGCSKGRGRQKKFVKDNSPDKIGEFKVEKGNIPELHDLPTTPKKKRLRRTIKNPKRFTALKNKT